MIPLCNMLALMRGPGGLMQSEIGQPFKAIESCKYEINAGRTHYLSTYIEELH